MDVIIKNQNVHLTDYTKMEKLAAKMIHLVNFIAQNFCIEKQSTRKMH